MPVRLILVAGARPNFIKIAPVMDAIQRCNARTSGAFLPYLVHTGQHYDREMSDIFFEDLDIPSPDVNLGIGAGTHAEQTARVMIAIERVFAEWRPDLVLVFGDVNSTIASALVASKLGIPVAHVEAGLRSFDMTMPEEVNRVVVDRISTYLFCPTVDAEKNLQREGIVNGVHVVGDVMFDAAIRFREIANERSSVIERLNLDKKAFVLATVHRDFNTDDEKRLTEIVDGLVRSEETIVFPAHPRVRKELERFGLLAKLDECSRIHRIGPVSYLDMICLEMGAKAILTDSGGVQKEAFFHRVPCITVRPSTEWVETVECGWNQLVDADAGDIASAMAGVQAPAGTPPNPFGNGQSASSIADVLLASFR